MKNQNEITQPTALLDEKGNLTNPGFARKMLYQYDRNAIKAGKMRIKEWDYYLVYNDDYGIALTVDDNSYMGMMSASILDFKNKVEKTVSPINLFPKGKTNLPSTSEIGDTIYNSKRVSFRFLNDGKKRVLDVYFKNFHEKQDFSCHFELTDEPEESMVIATPFDKPKHFYLNQKIVGFKATGWAKLGEHKLDFSEDSFGLLDWGRGVWTYSNTWYWSAAMGKCGKHKIGFNLGYGFGNTEKATENMFFLDGKAHKLNDVDFGIPGNDTGKPRFLDKWLFTSSDNTINLEFEPFLDRNSCTSLVVLKSDQHQVFGRFNGFVVLEDGQKFEIKNLLGFAEKVINKW